MEVILLYLLYAIFNIVMAVMLVAYCVHAKRTIPKLVKDLHGYKHWYVSTMSVIKVCAIIITIILCWITCDIALFNRLFN